MMLSTHPVMPQSPRVGARSRPDPKYSRGDDPAVVAVARTQTGDLLPSPTQPAGDETGYGSPLLHADCTASFVNRCFTRGAGAGVSRPRWVGGFATDEAAKAARDEARVKARQGEYIDRNSITVTAYLDDWIASHAMEIKPRTLHDYRSCIRLYVTPRIGNMPVQAVRPSTITRLYRDLLTSGGVDGKPLAVTTVTHLHAVLRKAFRDAVIVDELIASNPVERAKRPRAQANEPGTVWTVAQLRAFLSTARQHRLFAFFHVAAYTGARRGELLNLQWSAVDLDGKKITLSPDRPLSLMASGSPGPPRAAGPVRSPSMTPPWPSSVNTGQTRSPTSSVPETPGWVPRMATSSRPAGVGRSTPTL